MARGDGRAFQQQLPSERCPIQGAHREHLRGHGVTTTALQAASGRGIGVPETSATTRTPAHDDDPAPVGGHEDVVDRGRSEIGQVPAGAARRERHLREVVRARDHASLLAHRLTDRASHSLRDLTLVAGLSLQPVEGSHLPEEPTREDDRNHHACPRAEMPLAAQRLQASAGRNGEHRERGQQEPRREAGDEEQVLHREGDPHDGRHAHPERSPAIRAGPKRPRAETDQHHPPQDADPGERTTRLRTEQRAVGEPEVFGDAGERAAHVGHRACSLDGFAGPAVSNAHLDQPGERAHRHPHDHGHDRPHGSAHQQDHDRRGHREDHGIRWSHQRHGRSHESDARQIPGSDIRAVRTPGEERQRSHREQRRPQVRHHLGPVEQGRPRPHEQHHPHGSAPSQERYPEAEDQGGQERASEDEGQTHEPQRGADGGERRHQHGDPSRPRRRERQGHRSAGDLGEVDRFVPRRSPMQRPDDDLDDRRGSGDDPHASAGSRSLHGRYLPMAACVATLVVT